MKGRKTGGRRRGTPNKSTSNFRELITTFLEENWLQVQEDFDELEAKDRLLFFEKLLKYVVPAQCKNEVTFESLPDAVLDQIITQLTNIHYGQEPED